MGASRFRALALIGAAATLCATFAPHVTRPSVASKRAETDHPDVWPPQWLPVLLALCGQTVTGSTSGSSNQIGNLAPDHIYDFCTSARGTHTFNSCGSGFDTWLRVWTHDLSLQLLSCDDCGGCGTQTILTGELDVGCYKLVIDGFSSSSGTYTVAITCPLLPPPHQPPPPTPPAPPPPPPQEGWRLGALGQSCASVCTGAGLACDPRQQAYTRNSTV